MTNAAGKKQAQSKARLNRYIRNLCIETLNSDIWYKYEDANGIRTEVGGPKLPLANFVDHCAVHVKAHEMFFLHHHRLGTFTWTKGHYGWRRVTQDFPCSQPENSNATIAATCGAVNLNREAHWVIVVPALDWPGLNSCTAVFDVKKLTWRKSKVDQRPNGLISGKIARYTATPVITNHLGEAPKFPISGFSLSRTVDSAYYSHGYYRPSRL